MNKKYFKDSTQKTLKWLEKKKGQPNYTALKASNVCIRAQAHSAAFFFFFARDQVSMDKECGYVC